MGYPVNTDNSKCWDGIPTAHKVQVNYRGHGKPTHSTVYLTAAELAAALLGRFRLKSIGMLVAGISVFLYVVYRVN